MRRFLSRARVTRPPVPEQQAVAAFVTERIVRSGRPPNVYDAVGSHASHVVAAARARGLEVREIADGRFFYSDGVPVGGMRRMTTTLVGEIAVQICASKHLSRELFATAGLPVARGAVFGADELAAGQEYLGAVSGPLAVKPSRGRGGGGVTVGVSTAEELERAWEVALDASDRRDRVVVEEQVHGLDVRAFVVGDRLAAAAVRVPAYVVGDGRTAVDELVRRKRADRESNAYLARMPFVVDGAHLRRAGLDEESVPDAGEVVTLNGVTNLHQGGENVDVTDDLGDELAGLAVAVARAVPGLEVAGVDLLVPSLGDASGAVVLEANTSANLSVHHVPAHGEPRDVGGAIVDRMLARAGRPPGAAAPVRPAPR